MLDGLPVSGLDLDTVPEPLDAQVRVTLGLHLAVEEGRLTLADVHVANLKRTSCSVITPTH